MATKVVALHIIQGTVDYSFFTQIFSVKSLPSVYVIENGTVSGVFEKTDETLTPESFVTRLSMLLEKQQPRSLSERDTADVEPAASSSVASPPPDSQVARPAAVPPTPASGSTPASTDHRSSTLISAPASEFAPGSTPASTAVSTPTTTPSTPIPTGSRSDSGPLKTSHSHNPKTPNPGASHDASTLQYQESLRRQRRKDKEERERILKMLESDREERRRLAQMRKFQEDSPTPSVSTPPPLTSSSKSLKKSHEDCALLIRLFDGTALKKKFKAKETLADVRIWVDESRTDGAHPYSFFQPMIRKTFGDGEENQTLLELDLAPSASLVLKPAKGAISAAYESGAALGSYVMLQRGAASVAGAVYTFLGIGYKPPQREQEPVPEMDVGDARMVREAAASAAQMRTSGLGNESENDNTMHANSGTASIVRSGISSPRPALSKVSSSTSVNRLFDERHAGLGSNPSASSSTSNLGNVRTIHSSRAARDDDNDNEERRTYNGNQLSLEDNRDADEKK